MRGGDAERRPASNGTATNPQEATKPQIKDTTTAEALDIARELARAGVPLFLAKPALDEHGEWDPAGGRSRTGYLFPSNWQRRKADPKVVDRWRPGMALCALMGHAVDGVDVDPQKGGQESYDELDIIGGMPRAYGKQTTPSGGYHELVAPLGVHSRDKVGAGLDVKAGAPDGEGRGFLFLAPTQKLSKTTGEVGQYRWVERPRVDEIPADDDSGRYLAGIIEELRSTPTKGAEDDAEDVGPGYVGPGYEDLTPALRKLADDHVRGQLDGWRARLAEAQDWPESARDDKSRGWELLAKDFAWALAMLAACPWTGFYADDAGRAFADLLPEIMSADPLVGGKWSPGLVGKAARKPVAVPPWGELSVVADDDEADPANRAEVDVGNAKQAFQWLRREVGRRHLSGFLRRGRDIVFTSRVGERGYIAAKQPGDYDGPAQVHRVDATDLAVQVDCAYYVFKLVGKGKNLTQISALFPGDVAARVLAGTSVPTLRNVKDLRGVTHTPMVRADGTILDRPGYDEASGMLYLPDSRIELRPVPEAPTRADLDDAVRLLLKLTSGFPWVTPHDRANFLGALLTPAIRPLFDRPFKLVLITAPQRGSGKGYLGTILRVVHGGVLRVSFPERDEEVTKSLVSILDSTSAPVVQFDNVTGVLKSAALDGALTTREWRGERLLGGNKTADLLNDRLWVVTGNNLRIGGDLVRRTLKVTIDARMPHPERRAADSFEIPDLQGWLREHRGEVLHALLVLVRAWVVAGRPLGAEASTDDYGDWVRVVRGILDNAPFGDAVGQFADEETSADEDDVETEEWSTFLAAIRRVFGDERWLASEVIDRVQPNEDDADDETISAHELPSAVAEVWGRPGSNPSRVLGNLLKARRNSWFGEFQVRSAGKTRNHVLAWRVER